MNLFGYFLLFFFGTLIGSYLDVLATRYSTKRGFKDSLRGRSRCEGCEKALRWFELIPLLSFLAQKGKCRRCGNKLTFRYPIVEVITGLIFIFVPFKLGFGPETLLWLFLFLILLVITLIDIRLRLIPDQLNLVILGLGVIGLISAELTGSFGLVNGKILGSSLGSYALIFWLGETAWINYLAGALVGLFLFGALYFLSRGRGMGMGDVKLAASLGLFVGWPDIIFSFAAAFILGAVVGLVLMVLGKKRLKSSLPFGPFIALGVTVIFFFGYHILDGYFALFS
ncbi:MAG: prepilin peptidase [Candidatus Colwellbacteria bacterium]|nr:prepilin peptidase [Candidatus Colwellbacteria bacterium]